MKGKLEEDSGIKNPIERYFNEPELRDWEQLSREEEKMLGKRKDRGDEEARQELIESNLRLAVSVAKKYRDYGLPFEDLIQEANKGLIKAADGYDWRKGNKFSTYAVWWIRQGILEDLNKNSRTIRIPKGQEALYRKITDLEDEYKRKNPDELMERWVTDRINEREDEDYSIEKIKRCLIAHQTTKSLDDHLSNNEKEGKTYLTKCRDPDSDPEAEAYQDLMEEELEELLEENLHERQRRILKLRYGLEDHKSRTLVEVGEVFDISRERVRQLQEEAIETLKGEKGSIENIKNCLESKERRKM